MCKIKLMEYFSWKDKKLQILGRSLPMILNNNFAELCVQHRQG